MSKIDKKLRKILDRILDNEDNTGCDGDLTVTSKAACDALRKYLNDNATEELAK